MGDTTLTQGLLSRLDAVTAKMGVAASEVWSIWIATSWRPALEAGFLIVLGLVLLIGGIKSIKHGIAIDNNNDDAAPIFAMGGVIAAILGGIVVLVAFLNIPDAIAYLAEPRLYAIDQLRGLVGK